MIKEKLLKHPKFEKNKEKITIEKALYILIILCPILDILSFLFRNTLNTKISPSTILRPIIPIIVILYIFIKKHIKLKLLIVAIIYLIYSIIHLFCFSILKTNSSYSGMLHELQYIINYSFIILNLFIYLYCFKNKNVDKLKKSILILSTIYILSIFISILTKTSSMTYIEAMGYKGWIESGNSLSSILILSLFVILNLIKIEKYRYWAISVIILIIIFLTTLIGTRVGLYGCILVLFIYAATEIFVAIIHKIQLNKFVLLGALSTIITIVI
ncbi:MAG: hypothetical protein HFJ53_07215, partial [Clostridia bacterium]|nr:hypothetical protein [Clostridia bacterium]